MPKSMIIDPQVVRKADVRHIPSIPINTYVSNIEKERKIYGDDTLRRIYRTMLTIRAFEELLHSVKTQQDYQGIRCLYPGPAHLSIGQEAAAVGLCLNLDITDLLFGSHRSHGEILAKSLLLLDIKSEEDLLHIMRQYPDTFSVIEKMRKNKSIKELSYYFILYGVLAEIFGCRTGFNAGLGGSMHAFCSAFGSMPNNAIVGGSAAIAAGAALFKRVTQQRGIVVASIGDAALACGPVWEAMNFSAMGQYRSLWEEKMGGSPPLLFHVLNNFYGMGGQTTGETMGQDIAARVGCGINAENMYCERVDGYNPLAVANAVAEKKKILLAGKGPVLLDTITYRLSGHSPSDASSYRTRDEIQLWQQVDCVHGFGEYLRENSLITKEELTESKKNIETVLKEVLQLVLDKKLSPHPSAGYIEGVMFSSKNKAAEKHTKVQKRGKKKPEVLLSYEKNPRVQALKKRQRYGIAPDGDVVSLQKRYTYRDAIFEALISMFYTDRTLVAFGEENRDWGGAFAAYRGLTESLPYHRLFNSPISEAAIVGAGVGYALSGGKAVVELMYCDFMGRAGDEIFNQMPKWQAMSGGTLHMPLTLRISVGNKYGAQHSQEWSGFLAHLPGLKAAYPATPYDAKGILYTALHGDDPVVFLESQKLYNHGEYFVQTGVPEAPYMIPWGIPVIRKAGSDLTICTLGPTLYPALEAAEVLHTQWGLDTEVIDLRFINPLDYTLLQESIKKTHRILLVSDAVERASFLQHVSATLTQLSFDDLDAPPAVLGSRNWITPPAVLETLYFPQKEWIIDCVHERLLPLSNHVPTTTQTIDELARRQQMGV